MQITNSSSLNTSYQSILSKKKEEENKGEFDMFGAINSQTGSEKSSSLSYSANGVSVKVDSPDARTVAAKEAGEAAKEKFQEFMDMTPAERMRAQILAGMGITEEQLAALPPEEREKIEDQIAAIIRQKIEEAVKDGEGQEEEVSASNGPNVPPHNCTSNEINKAMLNFQEAVNNDTAFEDTDQGVIDISGYADEERKALEEMMLDGVRI
jgi:hypothetical protein